MSLISFNKIPDLVRINFQLIQIERTEHFVIKILFKLQHWNVPRYFQNMHLINDKVVYGNVVFSPWNFDKMPVGKSQIILLFDHFELANDVYVNVFICEWNDVWILSIIRYDWYTVSLSKIITFVIHFMKWNLLPIIRKWSNYSLNTPIDSSGPLKEDSIRTLSYVNSLVILFEKP